MQAVGSGGKGWMHLIRKQECAKANLSNRGVLGKTVQEEKLCFQCR